MYFKLPIDGHLFKIACLERHSILRRDSKTRQLPWRVRQFMLLGPYMMCLEKQSLWWTGIHKLIGQTAAESACFGKDFLSGILIKRKHQFLMLKRT